MNLKIALLLSAALGIGTIGCGYVIAPQFMFGLYGISLQSVNELNMVRSAYGGLFVGFAVLFLLGAIRPLLSRPAMYALFTFMAGFAVGRIVSVVVDGRPSMLIAALMVLEVSYASAAAYFLFQSALRETAA
jgi:uncharacterized membrane protein YjjP (DUF1212 family)